MIQLPLKAAINDRVSQHFDGRNSTIQFQSIGGGSINQTYKLSFANKAIFCKINSGTKFPHLFQRESSGLELIRKQGIIQAAEVFDCFEANGMQILLLKWIHEGERSESFWKKFGEQLAALHHITAVDFGLDEDNFMGSVPQSNRPSVNWTNFFVEQRLNPLLQLCTSKKLLSYRCCQQFENLYQQVPNIFDKEQKPALLHGDLWSGNFMCNQGSEPVLIDPAVYFGHPSVDLGMTTLFGGFAPSFYEAYRFHSPFPSNYEEQWQVCNLYPLLIHLYLFGSSYLTQVEQTLSRYQ